ncbi:hypothetical protein [Nocardioides insulae]|uniref:hypothetical protein n=1 Tax=Nocardioides insulae TaxID=394734 RepID=UPI0004004FD0|nr:hypothetical protein [Nocardioides insulae]
MAEQARPSQVTLAGWSIVVGSVLVVLTAYDTISGLTSLETRESVQEMLTEAPDSFGVTVDQMLEVMRWSTMVAAAAAAASAVLGWSAMRQRSKSARIALTVLAVPLFVGGMSGGGFFVGLVAAGVLLLWLQPSRDWFDGTYRPAAERSARETSSARASSPSGETPGPVPPHSSGVAGGQPGSTAPAPTTLPVQPHAPAYPVRRPSAVMTAAVLTWVFCALSVIVVGLALIVALGDMDGVTAEMERTYPGLMDDTGYTEGMLQAAVILTCAMLIGWALGACLVAWLALRGHDWARILVIVSAATAGVFMVIGTFSMPVLLIPLLACGATAWLLLRPEVGAWYAEKRREAIIRR